MWMVYLEFIKLLSTSSSDHFTYVVTYVTVSGHKHMGLENIHITKPVSFSSTEIKIPCNRLRSIEWLK